MSDESEVVRANFCDLHKALDEGEGLVAFGVHNDGVGSSHEQTFIGVLKGDVFDVVASSGKGEGQFTQFSRGPDGIEDGAV